MLVLCAHTVPPLSDHASFFAPPFRERQCFEDSLETCWTKLANKNYGGFTVVEAEHTGLLKATSSSCQTQSCAVVMFLDRQGSLQDSPARGFARHEVTGWVTRVRVFFSPVQFCAISTIYMLAVLLLNVCSSTLNRQFPM